MQQREQRPLQTSMILPSQLAMNQGKRPSNQGDFNFQKVNPQKLTNFLSSQHYQGQNILLQPNRQHQYQLPQGHVDQHHPGSSRTHNNDVIHDIFDRIEKLTKSVDKHQLQLSSLVMEGDVSKRVLNQMKKSLPAIPGNLGNQFSELIFAMKTDIKILQQQVLRTPKLTDVEMIIKKQFQSQKKQLSSSGGSSLSTTSSKTPQIEPHINELIRKRDQFFQNIIANIQTQVSILKKSLNNMNIQMKVSPIVSNSCIMLKYQQLFKARNKNESDMILSQNTYYIDNQGFLLDNQSRYIVDQKGKKIKLQDKHISMLKNQKILQ